MPKYDYVRIPRHPAALAQLYSLALPMNANATEKELTTKYKVVKLLTEYRSCWIKRVGELRGLGWHGALGVGAKYLTECPPVFSYCKASKQRLCRRYLICPFCWARTVTLPCYRRFEMALFGSNTIPRKAEAKQRAAKETVTNYKLANETPMRTYDLERRIEELVLREREVLARRRRELREALGSFWLTTIDVVPSEGDFRWRVRQRLLSILPESFKLPEGSPSSHLTRASLALNVGRTCAYPLGMLHGPAEETLEILEARSGSRGRAPRLSVYHGALRGQKPNNYIAHIFCTK